MNGTSNKNKNILSVGCGKSITDDNATRLDICPDINPDVVWDLNNYPYPFDDSSFTEIECFDTIEHLEKIPQAVEEFHRILMPDGLLKVTTPHFSCANSYVDPTHRWHLSYFSFDYFQEDNPLSYYSQARFNIKNRQIHFKGNKFTTSIVRRLANRFPETWEQRWAWIFPGWFLYFELQAVKSQ